MQHDLRFARRSLLETPLRTAAAIANLLPARKATAVDPVQVLRSER